MHYFLLILLIFAILHQRLYNIKWIACRFFYILLKYWEEENSPTTTLLVMMFSDCRHQSSFGRRRRWSAASVSAVSWQWRGRSLRHTPVIATGWLRYRRRSSTLPDALRTGQLLPTQFSWGAGDQAAETTHTWHPYVVCGVSKWYPAAGPQPTAFQHEHHLCRWRVRRMWRGLERRLRRTTGRRQGTCGERRPAISKGRHG